MLQQASAREAGVVEVFDNVIGNPTEIIRFLEDRATWDSATIFGNTDEPIVESYTRDNDVTFYSHTCLRTPPLIYDMIRTVYQYLDDYAARYGVTFRHLEPVNINRYKTGQKYHIHYDDGPAVHRVISALLYLNDVEEGGETYFPAFDLTVKPAAARLVLFPSNYAYAHAALPPTKGVKYSVAFWTDM